LVLDASMAIAWLFDDERGEVAHGVLRRIVAEGAIVPSLWRLEVANVLRHGVRRGRRDESHAVRSLERLGRLSIVVDEETDDHAWGETRALSLEQGLTLYDAAYLELAIRTARPLASCDRDLLAAAGRRGVDILSA
jgi:predicted nucleic acid-binding protein